MRREFSQANPERREVTRDGASDGAGSSGASYLDRSLQLEQDGLGDEDFAGLGAEVADLGLKKLDLLAGAAAPHLQQAVDY